MATLLPGFLRMLPSRRFPCACAYGGALLLFAAAGCDSHSVSQQRAPVHQQTQPADQHQTNAGTQQQKSGNAENDDLTFPGYRLVKDWRLQQLSQEAPTEHATEEIRRSPERQVVHDLDQIKTGLKLAVEYNRDRYSIVGRIANTGEQDVLVNTDSVGYFGSVRLKWQDTYIPRDPDNSMRFVSCAGPSTASNLVMPSRSILQSFQGNFSWLHDHARSPEERMRLLEQAITTPVEPPRISFHDDLLDFDWSGVEGEVEIAVCQRLLHRPPKSKGYNEWVTYQIESNPITVDVDALKAYRNRLLKKGNELRKAEDTNKPDLAQGRD